MVSTKYTYTISTSFPNAKVESTRLTQEIQSSAITIAIERIDTNDDICDIWFKDALSQTDEAILNGLVAVHSGEPIPQPAQPVIVSNSITVANPTLTVNAMPPSGLKSNQISQNWCDKTTWWYSAVQVINESATTNDGYRKIWNLSHQNIIDVYHGKLTGEEALPNYRVLVSADGIQKTEQDPHYGTGGDYKINYTTGTITFFEALADGISPIVTYYYENGSTWIIQPTLGEKWKLKGAESQFSEDVILNDSMVYEVWAYNPYDLPNKMMVAAPDYYKTIYDFINDANKAYPQIPPLGGSGWRGANKQTYIFSWDFQTTTELLSSYGMELRVRLEHDSSYGGTFATGTFYFIRESE
jgi:hypothetical protein